MKKPKRKKPEPKFYKGQVVYYRTREAWVKVVSALDAQGHCGIRGHEDRWSHVSELRPLTAKEIGPRRKRG